MADDNQSNPKQDNDPRNPAADAMSVNISGRIELEVPQTEGVKKKRAETKTYCGAIKTDFFRQSRKVRFLAEALTLIVLGIYTVINFCLYKTTAASFHADQRPWVGVDSLQIRQAIKRANGSYLPQGHVIIRNFGPRVARKVFTIAGAFLTEDPDQVCGMIEHNCASAWSFASGQNHEGVTLSETGIKYGRVLFPQQAVTEGIYGAFTVNRALPTQVFLPGCTVYYDQFGGARRTRFCFDSMFDGVNFSDWQQCQICNDAN